MGNSSLGPLINMVIAMVSVAAGGWALMNFIPELNNDHFRPIMMACRRGSGENVLYDYDKRVALVVFDFMVCFITKFLYDLATLTPMGILTWGTLSLSVIPAMTVILLEANRKSNGGPLKWPVTLVLLGQCLGLSVVFPMVWVPSYVVFAGQDGTVNATFAKLVAMFAMPFFLLTVVTFSLDISSDIWKTCAGIMGGPLICVFAYAPALFETPDETATPQQVAQTSRSSAISFGVGGLVSTVGWFYMLYLVYMHFGTDYQTLFQAIWTNAHPAVKFASIDAFILWVGMILHIATRKVSSVVEAIALTPLFGPGGACCMALASLEVDRATVTKRSKKD
jgi:hypothetical protein